MTVTDQLSALYCLIYTACYVPKKKIAACPLIRRLNGRLHPCSELTVTLKRTKGCLYAVINFSRLTFSLHHRLFHQVPLYYL